MKFKIFPNIILCSLLLLGGTSLDAFGFLGFGDSSSWKEEVQLHDGGKIVVKRWQSHGGRHELGQPLPIKDHSVSFSLPGSGNTVTWKDDYSEDVGMANFLLLALHIRNDTPYLVTSPVGCLGYNKWGRPNPPYVFFKYDGTAWQRISLEEFPAEFKDINLVIRSYGLEKKLLDQGVVSAEMVKKFNSDLTQPYLKTIIRTPLEPGSIGVSCKEMISDGKNGWLGLGWFSSAPSYSACLKVCEKRGMSAQICPCDALLKSNPKWR